MVYVDDFRVSTTFGRYRNARMSHMTADTIEELHEFAAKLGLQRSWYQESWRPEACHYDVTDTKRAEAIALGAKPETMTEGARRRIAAMRARGA